MIQVLAVLSQYEFELFAARGIDGKITALKTRGTSNGGPGPYGYKHSSKNSKLVIDPEEAEVVRRIFNYYIQDKTPTPFVEFRVTAGVPPPGTDSRKICQFCGSQAGVSLHNPFVWSASNRIVSHN